MTTWLNFYINELYKSYPDRIKCGNPNKLEISHLMIESCLRGKSIFPYVDDYIQTIKNKESLAALHTHILPFIDYTLGKAQKAHEEIMAFMKPITALQVLEEELRKLAKYVSNLKAHTLSKEKITAFKNIIPVTTIAFKEIVKQGGIYLDIPGGGMIFPNENLQLRAIFVNPDSWVGVLTKLDNEKIAAIMGYRIEDDKSFLDPFFIKDKESKEIFSQINKLIANVCLSANQKEQDFFDGNLLPSIFETQIFQTSREWNYSKLGMPKSSALGS